ncbi:MAG: hypothetical protein H7270_07725 [Dermatophilaceae bacterium]|nr:hypothetical protein [Dermatophilaceae bacterium]
MMVREIAARYLGEGGTIRVDADPEVLAALGRAGPVADLGDGVGTSQGDVVLIAVDPLADNLTDRLLGVSTQGVTVLLHLPVAVGDLPVGRLAQAAGMARLAFVEIAPIEPGWSLRTVIVCRPSPRPVPVRPFLGDDSAGDDHEVDLDSQGLRIGWEWGLGSARARAVEELGRTAVRRVGQLERELVEVRGELEKELVEARVELQQELVEARRDLKTAHEVVQRAESRAIAEAQRRAALQQSPSFLVGRAVLTVRRHPIRGLRQLTGVIDRGTRRPPDPPAPA